jgi:hypothetical protein
LVSGFELVPMADRLIVKSYEQGKGRTYSLVLPFRLHVGMVQLGQSFALFREVIHLSATGIIQLSQSASHGAHNQTNQEGRG